MEVLYWTLCCQQNLPQTKKKSLAYFAISPALRNSIFQIHFLLQLQQKGRQAFVLVESEKQREKKKKRFSGLRRALSAMSNSSYFIALKLETKRKLRAEKGFYSQGKAGVFAWDPFTCGPWRTDPAPLWTQPAWTLQAAVLNFLKDSPWGSWLKFRLPNFRSTGPVEGEHPGF